jgi:hypothetical protein
MYYPYDYKIVIPNKFTSPYRMIMQLKNLGIISPVISTESWITGDANPRLVAANATDYYGPASFLKPYKIYNLQSNKPIPTSVCIVRCQGEFA